MLNTQLLAFLILTKKQTFFKSGFLVYRRINEVKIYVFENYFLKKRSCATATRVNRSSFYSILNFI